MDAASAVAYLAACSVLTLILTRRLAPYLQATGALSLFLAGVVIFSSLFFACFLLLGGVELALGVPVVSSFYAAAVALGALVVTLGAVGLARRDSTASGIAAELRQWTRSPSQSRQVRTLLLLATGVFVFSAATLVAGYPRSFEALAYHLPIALHVFQAHSLVPWDRAFNHTLPANASLYYGFLFTVFPERFVSLSNLILLIPTFVTIYGLARLTGADRTASSFASLGYVTIPIVALSARSLAADTGGWLFLAIAIYFVLAEPHGRPVYLILSGLAAGLAFGYKNLHVIGLVYLGGLALLQGWVQADAGAWRSAGRSVRQLLLWLLPALVISGFWLALSYVEFHNPFYPVHLSVFDLLGWAKAPDLDPARIGAVQFRWVRSWPEWFVYPWLERETVELRNSFNESSGVGPFVAGLVPVACLFAILLGLSGTARERRLLVSLLAGGAFVLACWWGAGFHEPRYGMAALLFLLPLVAWLIDGATGRSRRAIEGIASVSILVMMLVLFSKQAIELGDIVYSRLFTRQAFYEYPAAIDRLPPNSTIVNLGGRMWNYALFSSTHQNRVVSYEEALRTMSSRKPLCYFGQCDPGSLSLDLALLQRLGATHVFTLGASHKLVLPDCVQLREIDRLDYNPVNGHRLPEPRILSEIRYCNRNGSTG
jgi:hypothetical protein